MTRVVPSLLSLAAVAVALVLPAQAEAKLLTGLFDDAQVIDPLLNSTGDAEAAATFDQLAEVHSQVLRIQLRWDRIALTAPVGDPSDPRDTSYTWSRYDRAVRLAAARGIEIFFTIYGTPVWNNPLGPAYKPTDAALRAFAKAAATRYNGDFDPNGVPSDPGYPVDPLPRVRYWGAWNEPNINVFLRPQWKRSKGKWVSVAPVAYAKMCNSVVAGIRSTQPYASGSRVVCGLTVSRGRKVKSASSAHGPLVFLRKMKAAGAKFDIYGHQPYSHNKQAPGWKPKTKPTIVTLGNMPLLIKELNRTYGKKMPIWITEFAYQTDPPDQELGVPAARQQRWMKDAHALARKFPRIKAFIWFLLKDEPDLNGPAFATPGWQSGLLYADGTKKPSWTTFTNLPR